MPSEDEEEEARYHYLHTTYYCILHTYYSKTTTQPQKAAIGTSVYVRGETKPPTKLNYYCVPPHTVYYHYNLRRTYVQELLLPPLLFCSALCRSFSISKKKKVSEPGEER